MGSGKLGAQFEISRDGEIDIDEEMEFHSRAAREEITLEDTDAAASSRLVFEDKPG